MGACWIILAPDKTILIEKEIYLKKQNPNKAKLAEAIVLLDLIRTIEHESYQIESGKIQVTIDNRKVWQITQEEMKIVNKSN